MSEHIPGAAVAVLNELKPGLDEKLHENARVIDLLERGPEVFKVEHKGRETGRLIPNLIVDDLIFANPTSCKRSTKSTCAK